MILPGVDLSDGPAHTRFVIANDYEQILGNKAHISIGLHQFDMGKTLPVGTDFILALDNENPTISKHSECFLACITVKFKHRFMVLSCCLSSRSVVAVMLLECGVSPVGIGCAAGGVHVRWVEDDAVYFPIVIRKVAAIHSGLNISPSYFIIFGWNLPPKHPLAIGYICNDATRLHIQAKNAGKYLIVSGSAGAEHQVVGGPTVTNDPPGRCFT